MLRQWMRSEFVGEAPYNHTFFRNFLLLVGATLAGFTVINFPPGFLAKMTHPLAQFFIYWTLSYGLYWSKLPGGGWFVTLDAILFVALVQLASYLLERYYPKEIAKERIYELKVDYEKDGARISGRLPSQSHRLEWKWDKNRLNVWSEKSKNFIENTVQSNRNHGNLEFSKHVSMH